uniref:Uncharacterized protein n=1 Tax=Globisporangium ultimum (strain ATCC 200006 / CBS 805.95 / DAOM BR144) TaxID=431595 RepID=K3X8G0_GLOUD
MASNTTGYQGFRSFAVQECPTLKTGETYASRATKFSKMGSRIITPPETNRLGKYTHESIAAQSIGGHVMPSDYHVPDKRGVMVHEKLPATKPFIATSTYQQDFAAFDDEMRAVLAVPLESYAQAFVSVADGEDHGEQHTIELCQVPHVLKRALGDAATARVIEIFRSFLDRQCGSARDHLSWENLERAVTHVHDVFAHELEAFAKNLKRTGSFSGVGPLVKVIPATTPASSYTLDYGVYGDQPLDRPYVRKRGMASTTADLTPGTTQNTHQMPGYVGFLPRTTHNPHAVAQADGAVLRSPRGDLRLYHSSNLPGYTGHKPVDCANFRGECRAGSDPRTTTGAGYHPHI